ncbi:MAG TPA: hypothetical protein VL243_14705 [Vicinamibacterales bacterium]|nr:hypothetical protein [Vicinamibacterales bacterium]
MKKKYKSVWLIVLLLIGGVRLAAIDEVTLFRVFLTDGTAVVSYGEYARVGDRIVFSMPIGLSTSVSSTTPALHVVNIPANAVDWAATSKYAERARFAHYVATSAEADYAALTGEVAGVLNSVMFTKDPQVRLNLATMARKRLASWPQDHFGYRTDDVRQVLGVLDEVISDLRAKAGQTAFALDLIATVEPPPPPEPVMAPPSAAESIAQAVAVARVSDVPADRVAILRAVVAAIDDPRNGAADSKAKQTRRWAISTIGEEVVIDKRYAELSGTILRGAAVAARRADVREVERLQAAAGRRDVESGRKRPDLMRALLAQVQAQLDSARKLRLARDQWRERVGAFRAYLEAVTPVFDTLNRAQGDLIDIKQLAGTEAAALALLDGRLQDAATRLGAMAVPDELKPSHALLRSAVNLASNALKTRRQAVVAGDLKAAWDASSAAAGSMELFAKVRSDMVAAVTLPEIR